MIAICVRHICANGLFCLYFAAVGLLAGCGALQTPPRPLVYDFGPGAVAQTSASATAPSVADLPPLALASVQAASALDGTAVLYRLAYSDTQQLRPYAMARWSMPPAELLRQRLREHLGQRRAVLSPLDGVASTSPLLSLRVELDEFSQLFETPDKSTGLVRLRATLAQTSGGPETLLAQRSFVVQRPSASADAAGGVKALTAAADAAIAEMETWVQQMQAQTKAGLLAPSQ
jgi:cholesterol transport system auxiliary component